MRLGLGLGLSRGDSLAADGYDVIQILFEGEYIQGHCIDRVEDGKFIIAYADSNDDMNPNLSKSAILTRAGSSPTMTMGTAIQLDVVNPDDNGQSHVVKAISSSRALVVARNSNTEYNINLLDVSGGVPAILDSISITTTSESKEGNIAIMSETTAGFVYKEGGITNDYLRIITYSGDSLTIGAAVSVNTTKDTFPSLTALDSSRLLVKADQNLYLYSVSGTTPTLEDTETLPDTGATSAQGWVAAFTDTKAICVFVDQNSDMQALLVTANLANVISLGSAKQVTGDNIQLFTWNCFNKINATHAVVSYSSVERVSGVGDCYYASIMYDSDEDDIVVSSPVLVRNGGDTEGEGLAHEHVMATPSTETEAMINWQNEQYDDDFKEVGTFFATIPFGKTGESTISGSSSAEFTPTGGASVGWDLTNLTYTAESEAIGGTNSGGGLWFNNAGTLMIFHLQNDFLTGRTMSAGWDIANSSSDSSYLKGLDLPSGSINSGGMKYDGSKYYAFNSNESVYQFDLTTANDPSTLTLPYEDTSNVFSGVISNAAGYYTNADDTAHYAAESLSKIVYKATKLTGDDVSSLSLDTGNNIDVSSDFHVVSDIFLSDDETQLFVAGREVSTQGAKIVQYPLGTAGDLTSYISGKISKDISSQLGTDNVKMWMNNEYLMAVSSQSETLYKYTQ